MTDVATGRVAMPSGCQRGFAIYLYDRRFSEQGPPSCEELRHGGVGPGALIIGLVGTLVDVLDLLNEAVWLRVVQQETDANTAGSFVEGNCFQEKYAELGLTLCRDAYAKVKADGSLPRVRDR